MARMQDEKYMLLACSGRASLNIPRGHVFLVKTREGQDVEFLPEQEIYTKYGKPTCYMTSSDTLCPTCFGDIMGSIRKRQQGVDTEKV